MDVYVCTLYIVLLVSNRQKCGLEPSGSLMNTCTCVYWVEYPRIYITCTCTRKSFVQLQHFLLLHVSTCDDDTALVCCYTQHMHFHLGCIDTARTCIHWSVFMYMCTCMCIYTSRTCTCVYVHVHVTCTCMYMYVLYSYMCVQYIHDEGLVLAETYPAHRVAFTSRPMWYMMAVHSQGSCCSHVCVYADISPQELSPCEVRRPPRRRREISGQSWRSEALSRTSALSSGSWPTLLPSSSMTTTCRYIHVSQA